MIISFNGNAGSGKSTIAKMVAEKLGWPRYYIGGLRRKKAKEQGLTLAEYNKLGEEDPKTDTEVDEYQKKLGEKQNNFVIEGRTSWYFIPHSLKIYLYTDKEEAAKRVFKQLQEKNKRNEDKDLKAIKDVLESHNSRMRSDNKRYEKYYKINVYDKKHYDFLLNTSNLTIDQVFNKAWQHIANELDKKQKML